MIPPHPLGDVPIHLRSPTAKYKDIRDHVANGGLAYAARAVIEIFTETTLAPKWSVIVPVCIAPPRPPASFVSAAGACITAACADLDGAAAAAAVVVTSDSWAHPAHTTQPQVLDPHAGGPRATPRTRRHPLLILRRT